MIRNEGGKWMVITLNGAVIGEHESQEKAMHHEHELALATRRLRAQNEAKRRRTVRG